MLHDIDVLNLSSHLLGPHFQQRAALLSHPMFHLKIIIFMCHKAIMFGKHWGVLAPLSFTKTYSDLSLVSFMSLVYPVDRLVFILSAC
jgi:hypothetical protein